ncbi:MAG: hypothetical protein ACREQD_00375 [Candidatus Binataceae bacterium]
MSQDAGRAPVRRWPMFEQLVAAVGEEAARKVVETFGGARLYVPQAPQAGDALSRLVGPAAAARLAQVFGGDRVDVPNPPSRRERIIELQRQGLSVGAIAWQLGCTRRRVFQVLAEQRAAGRAALKREAEARVAAAQARRADSHAGPAETFHP